MRIVFETARLHLCVFEDSHKESTTNFWGDKEVMEFCGGPTPHELLLRIIDGYRTCHDVQGLSVYALINKETNEVIGCAGFNIVSSIEEVELIYHFNKSSWGKGYASEAAAACLDLAKSHGKIQKIIASASPENISSLKILEKLGFTYRGVRWFDDTQQDEHYYEYYC